MTATTKIHSCLLLSQMATSPSVTGTIYGDVIIWLEEVEMPEKKLQSLRRGPSMSQVAKAAGVSMQTVSRVSNGSSNVRPATRDRVLAAMGELGYRPNRAARALRSGRFNTVGVIVFTLSSYGNMRTIEAISVAAGYAGHTVTLLSVGHRTSEDVTSAFTRLQEQAVDGVIIIFESHILDRDGIDLPDGLPVVIIDSTDQNPRFDRVDTDQAQGARQATTHLLGLGHHTVWHLRGPRDSFSATRREASWRATLQDAGRPVPDVIDGDWTTHSGHAAGQWIAQRDDITAVFASNDQMALGLLRACHEHGRAIPETLSVVGFDDMPEADSFWPPLTTVRQHFDEVGRTAMRLLLDQFENGCPSTTPVIVPTELMVRRTTARWSKTAD
ncbi:MAG: LacI family DNA-binding transcriptional regulator [Gordonia sp. (in: high G+C Gram-positive bacteria)]